MTVRRLLVVSVVLALGGLAGIFSAGLLLSDGTGAAPASNPESGTIEVPARAPAIAGRDPVTGAAVSIGPIDAKPIVLTVWASWCVPCARGAPVLQAFARRHSGDAVVVGLDLEDEPADAQSFYGRFGWTFRSISDPDGAFAAELGIDDLPTTLVLDRGRLIVARVDGIATRKQLEDALGESIRPR